MHFSTKPVQILLAAAAVLSLSACGGAPSEDDIKTAIDKQMQAEAKAMLAMAGKQGAEMAKDFMPSIKSVKKIGCKEDGDKAYKCDVEMEVTQMGNTNKGVAPMRFVKGSDGWAASK